MTEVVFLASTNADLLEFPRETRQEVGYAIWLAETGDKALNVVPLVGFGGAGVLEVIASFDGDAYRAVYTVNFPGFIYILHAFKKKSRAGRATPKPDMALIKRRYRDAKADYDHRKSEELERKNAG